MAPHKFVITRPMELLHEGCLNTISMKKRMMNIEYTGSISSFLSDKIYINVSYLKTGVYEIYILYKGKVIKKVRFTHPSPKP
jgi:hypothetical protein